MLRAPTCLFLIAAALLAVPAPAPKRPNLTGEWKLNLEESDFGGLPAPEGELYRISHNEPVLKVSTIRVGGDGTKSQDVTYRTDGQETKATVDDATVRSQAHWEGKTLVIRSILLVSGHEITIKQKWTVTPDGRTLTMESELTSLDDTVKQVVVAEKQ